MSSEYTAEEKEEIKEANRRRRIKHEEDKHKKECPLLILSNAASTRGGRDIKCREDKCGWWEDSFEGCSIKVLAGAAAFLAGVGMDDEEE